MMGMLPALLAAGAAIGVAAALVVAASVPSHPVLQDALSALDERRPGVTDRPGGSGRLTSLLRRIPLDITGEDLELLGVERDRFLVQGAGQAAALAAVGPVLATGMAILDAPLPFAVPGALTVVALIAGWTGHARRARDKSDRLRAEMRYALVSYLQQVSLLRRGGAGVATALTVPSRTLTDSWAMRRIRDELEMAERAGSMPWEGLARFGERIGVDELTDLSRIAESAGHDGSAVVGTLLARAESLENELLADEHADAHRASGQMSTPGALQVFLIAAWVLFPAATALLSSV